MNYLVFVECEYEPPYFAAAFTYYDDAVIFKEATEANYNRHVEIREVNNVACEIML